MTTAGIPEKVLGLYEYRVGEFHVTAIHDGDVHVPIQGLVTNAGDKEIAEALDKAFLGPSTLPITFTTLLVTGRGKSILIDTGYGKIGPASAGRTSKALAGAGVDAAGIDVVLLSHLHPDHIGGLYSAGGMLEFPNAEIKIPEQEWLFWTSGSERTRAPESARAFFNYVDKILVPQKTRVSLYRAGPVESGLTAIDAPGHTPGHTAFLLDSGEASLLVLSDVTNHPFLFARNPDWQLLFDLDPGVASTTRRRILDMAATDRSRVAFFHAPFPATGHVVRCGGGYDFIPSQWSSSGT